jgi:hypothetical protein
MKWLSAQLNEYSECFVLEIAITTVLSFSDTGVASCLRIGVSVVPSSGWVDTLCNGDGFSSSMLMLVRFRCYNFVDCRKSEVEVGIDIDVQTPGRFSG